MVAEAKTLEEGVPGLEAAAYWSRFLGRADPEVQRRSRSPLTVGKHSFSTENSSLVHVHSIARIQVLINNVLKLIMN